VGYGAVPIGKYRFCGRRFSLYIQDSRIQGLLDFFVAVLDCADPEDGGSKLSQKAIEMYKSKRRHTQKGLNFHLHRCKNYNTWT